MAPADLCRGHPWAQEAGVGAFSASALGSGLAVKTLDHTHILDRRVRTVPVRPWLRADATSAWCATIKALGG